jgi:hypothetical protein
MTRQTFARWTCNACGAEKETDGTQPKGWAGYGFTEENKPDGQFIERGHLCPTCLGRVRAVSQRAARS